MARVGGAETPADALRLVRCCMSRDDSCYRSPIEASALQFQRTLHRASVLVAPKRREKVHKTGTVPESQALSGSSRDDKRELLHLR